MAPFVRAGLDQRSRVGLFALALLLLSLERQEDERPKGRHRRNDVIGQHPSLGVVRLPHPVHG